MASFKAGEVVDYVGVGGFFGFRESNREMEFRCERGSDAIVNYRGATTLVRMHEIKRKEPTHKEISARAGRARSVAKTEAARKNATAKRFSKQRFLDYLHEKQERMQAGWGFSDSNGWAQVHGKGVAANRAYGRFNFMVDLLDSIAFMEIFPFGKKRLLDRLVGQREKVSYEGLAGDVESKARAEGAVKAIEEIIADIEAKVM